MRRNPKIEYVAENEDGVMWFANCTVREARAEVAYLVSCHPARLKARQVFMRPARREDCPAWPHGYIGDDAPNEGDVDCTCWQLEEGWMWQCKADASEARPVWRVEGRVMPRWWYSFGRRRRRLLGATLYPAFRPVLWGGRLPRRANRLDRLLLGRWVCNVPGDTQLRPASADDLAAARRRTFRRVA